MRAIVLAALLCPSLSLAAPALTGDNLFSDRVNAILQETKFSAQKLTASIDEDDLLDMLRDRSPEVRKAALKNARYEMGIHTDVRDLVLQMARDTREDTGVRREAARTLFWISHMSEGRETLLDLAQDDREVPVRVMAYKALYHAAFSMSDVRDDVRDAARGERDPEVRKAAIWALFDCTGHSEVRDTLRDIVRSYQEDAATKIEAVKSLFTAMNDSDVRDLVLDLAKDNRTEKDLRIAAVYALYAAKNHSEVERLLVDLSRDQSDLELRVAAIKALGDDDLFMRAYFHLGTRTNPHHYVSPIENE